MKSKLSVDRVSRGGVIRSGVDWGWVVRSGGGGVGGWGRPVSQGDGHKGRGGSDLQKKRT